MIDCVAVDFGHAGQATPLLKAKFAQQSYAPLVHAQQNRKDVSVPATATTVDRVHDQTGSNASSAKFRVNIITEFCRFLESTTPWTIGTHRTPAPYFPRSLVDINRAARNSVFFKPSSPTFQRYWSQVRSRVTGIYCLVIDCDYFRPITLLCGSYRHLLVPKDRWQE
jgi:hypothetical protein